MVSIVGGQFSPMYFKDMIDADTGRTRVRMVQIGSEYYHIARRYMLRLQKTDFENKQEVAKYAAVCGLEPEAFKKEFSYLVENDLLSRIREERLQSEPSVEDVMTPF